MKFSYYTNLVLGIFNTALFSVMILIFVVTPNFVDGEDIGAASIIIFISAHFGVMGTFLLSSAYKIKQQMKLDRETKSFLA